MNQVLKQLHHKKCPYPYGTEEFYSWWETEHRIGKAAMMEELAVRSLLRKQIAKQKHGHQFDERDRRCQCGMWETEYVNAKPPAFETDHRELCPLVDNRAMIRYGANPSLIGELLELGSIRP